MAVMNPASPHPLRRRTDPVRPVGAWVGPALLALGVGLSVLGWATSYRLGVTEDTALELAQDAGTAQQQQTAAQESARGARAERDALAAIVIQRCDTGQITDRQLCDAARGTWHRPR